MQRPHKLLHTSRSKATPCAGSLAGTPLTGRRAQVALLFLTTGALFHERSWALWFSHAAGMLPLASLLDELGGAAKGRTCTARLYQPLPCQETPAGPSPMCPSSAAQSQ